MYCTYVQSNVSTPSPPPGSCHVLLGLLCIEVLASPLVVVVVRGQPQQTAVGPTILLQD